MQESRVQIAGVDALVVEGVDVAGLLVVFLHGYAMRPEDLSPFAHSLALPHTRFVFPRGIVPLGDGSGAWWPIDQEARVASMRQGPRDLADAAPEGRVAARAALTELLAAVRRPGERVLLAGFSQGGMLACDTVLMSDVAVDALAMLSASRIAIGEWQPRRQRLAGCPVLVSHGREDQDLAFSAGERLQEFLCAAGAQVRWVPFDGGHAIPFLVWREVRSFATELMQTYQHSPQSYNQGSLSYGTS